MSDYIDREELIKHIKDLPTWWADGSALCAYYLTKAITSIEEALPLMYKRLNTVNG